MKLKLTYKQLSLLRELLNNESDRIFLKKIKISKEKGFDEISGLQNYFKTINNPFCREGNCHLILKEIEKTEEKIQKELE